MDGLLTGRYAADPRDPASMIAAKRRYRWRRPWLWIFPRMWQVHWFGDVDRIEITGWRLKTAVDRRVERELDRCCCHPDQPRGHR